MGTTGEATRQPLNQASIVEAAMALADQQGLDGLTMRNLADHLGYKVMALYNHVANKDELLRLMADKVAVEVEVPTDIVGLAAARALIVSNRAAFVSHPWSCQLWLRCLPGPARTDLMEHLLRILNESGIQPDLAHHGYHAITNHVVGYTLQENGMEIGSNDQLMETAAEYMSSLDPGTHPNTVAHVKQHIDGETSSSFELVLDLILDGLGRQATKRGRPT